MCDCFLCLVNRNCPLFGGGDYITPVFGEQKLSFIRRWRLCALFPVFGELYSGGYLHCVW